MKQHKNTLEVVYVDINEIKENDYNPKVFSKEALKGIKDSIKKFGFADPLVLNNSSERKNILVGGHGRLRVAKELGFETIPVVYVNLNLEQEKELNIRLQKNQGSFDFSLLSNFGEEILKDIGFDNQDFEKIFMNLDIEEDNFDVANEIKKIKKAKSKKGELYQLGQHKLYCADSSDLESVKTLVGKEQMDLIYLDPIFNIGLSYQSGIGGKSNYGGQERDKRTDKEYDIFLNKIISNAVTVSKKDAHFFCYCDSSYIPMIANIYTKVGIKFRRLCLWLKGIANPTPQVAFSRVHEPCLYGTIGKPYLSPNHKNFDEVLNKDIGTGNQMIESFMSMLDVWAVKRIPGHEYQHCTQKPLSLHYKPFSRCSKVGDNILSLFGGSGGDLLSAHQLKRKCFMIELDPIFVDLIIKRYESFTGEKAVKIN